MPPEILSLPRFKHRLMWHNPPSPKSKVHTTVHSPSPSSGRVPVGDCFSGIYGSHLNLLELKRAHRRERRRGGCGGGGAMLKCLRRRSATHAGVVRSPGRRRRRLLWVLGSLPPRPAPARLVLRNSLFGAADFLVVPHKSKAWGPGGSRKYRLEIPKYYRGNGSGRRWQRPVGHGA